MFRRVSRLVFSGFSWCVFALAGLNLLPAPSEAADKPEKEPSKTVTVDLGGVKMEFVLIPQGKFMMGSPKDEKDRRDNEMQHEVEITKPFYLAKYPVTQEQYVAITRKKNPSWFCQDAPGVEKLRTRNTGQFPVERVTWKEAAACCDDMTKSDKEKRTFRLPTEAEWEYACRAGTKTAYFSGDQAKVLGEYAWFADNSEGRTHEVGTRKPNPWGLYDMHGNVWQWCEDYYGPYGDLKSDDPLRIVKHTTEGHVLRGGAWYFRAKDCRAAFRGYNKLIILLNNIGFRVAFSPN